MKTPESTAPTNRTSATRHTIRTVSLGTFWRLFRYPFILLSVSIIPRLMGDTMYGQYALFISVYVVFEYLSDVGITQIFGRFIPDFEARGESWRTNEIFHTFLIYGLVLTSLLFAALLVVARVYTFDGVPAHWFVIMGCQLMLSQTQGILFAFLYGTNQIAHYSSKEVMRSAFTFVLVLGFYLAFGLTGALCGLVANEVILTGIGIYWTRDRLFATWHRPRLDNFKPYLVFGLQFYIPLFLFGAMLRVGNIYVKWLTASSEQVAYFDIANQFLLLTATFLGLILSTLIPSLSALYSKGRHTTIDEYHRKALTYCGVAIFLAYNALGWLGREAIARVLGPSFAPVFGNAMLMVPAIFPSLIAYVGVNYTILKKQPKVYAAAVATGFVTLTLACLLGVPHLASAGAAIATICGYSAMAGVFCTVYWRHLRAIGGPFVKVALLGLLFTPLYRYTLPPAAAGLAYAATTAVYLLLLHRVGLIRAADLKDVIRAFRAGNPTEPV
jgi:O-antigen/teichoic acid export membrane protein